MRLEGPANLTRAGKPWRSREELEEARDLMEHPEEVERLIGEPDQERGGLSAMLNHLVTFVRRFVSMSEAQVSEFALWIVHTHAFAAADCTPYQNITSAEKGSGKTRTLEVAEPLVTRPWFTGKVTAAALYRKIHKDAPTLLLDETDAAFKGDPEYSEALRGILNSGYKRGGKASCCVGQGSNIEVRDFNTFSPKATAGIGNPPGTVADRAVPLRLKRAIPNTVEKFRIREVKKEADKLREKIEEWAAANIDKLRDSRPDLPPELTDRQQECVEPLLAIADAAGGDWPDKARKALIALCAEGRTADESTGKQLLSDIRDIFKERNESRIPSADLVADLARIETSPWAEWTKGKPITTNRLARLLRPFGIQPQKSRENPETTFRGYERKEFQDAFARYLPPEGAQAPTTPPPQPEQVEQANVYAGSGHFSNRNRNLPVPVAKSALSPIDMRVVPVVPVAAPPYGEGEAGQLGEGDL